MKTNLLFLTLSFTFFATIGVSQNLQVETIANLNASGGVVFGPDGNVYVSDFGEALGQANFNTKVYKVEYGTWEITEFASGFSGASGNRFDSQGNFYQSNPSGGRVSKVSTDGTVELNWVTNGMSGGPIGITHDAEDNIYVCIHGNNTIRKVTPEGVSTQFATSNLFNCPNGITTGPEGNFYSCNFNDGRITKITSDGDVSTLAFLPTFGGTGNGHITYKNGFLFVATIGTGQIYKLTLEGDDELIAGVSQGFSNNDGPALEATFSKPNGITASYTGDTMWVNCSVPTWLSNQNALHPGRLRMITGVCSLADVDCPLLNDSEEVINENRFAKLLPLAPNPASFQTELTYQINETTQNVKLKIVDASQKVLSVFDEGKKSLGTHNRMLDTSDFSAGLYYLILETKNFVLTQKMVVVK